MAILGSIIKGAIHLKDKLTSETNHCEAQAKVLQDLLQTAKDTAFGQQYDFEQILKNPNPPTAFKNNVPYFDYSTLNEQWWSKLQEGQKDITWPGLPQYYALSSGTTGKTSKRIPVTDDMLAAIKKAGIKQIQALSNFELPAAFFEKEIMMLGSSTDLNEHNNHLEGEISGITAANIPFWFQGYYKPGENIAKIADWDERINRIALNAKEWDIGALSGIPSWIELMLKKVIDTHQLKHIHEIWPNLSVYTSGGVAFSPYKKSFHALMGKPVTVIDTYLASEGFIACQTRPDTTSMELMTDHGIYFEFVPFSPEYIKEDGSLVGHAPSLSLAEVQLDQDYVLVISTVSGAWRYMIGDTIVFTSIENAEIKITGRTKFFLNIVGSQLSVQKMDDAILYLEKEFNTTIAEYTICAKRDTDGEFYHFWTIGSPLDPTLAPKIAETLDGHLQRANKNYKVARSKALHGVKLQLVKPEQFYAWNADQKKKGGQVKMERVMSEEKHEQWENFIQGN